jgi:dihydropteroate synthase
MFKIPAKDLVWAIHSPQIMGIINCTSDSFYAGSRQQNLESVLSKVAQFIKEGVSIVDIGAQSTRPNATLLSADLEIEQLVPVINSIRQIYPDNFEILILK